MRETVWAVMGALLLSACAAESPHAVRSIPPPAMGERGPAAAERKTQLPAVETKLSQTLQDIKSHSEEKLTPLRAQAQTLRGQLDQAPPAQKPAVAAQLTTTLQQQDEATAVAATDSLKARYAAGKDVVTNIILAQTVFNSELMAIQLADHYALNTNPWSDSDFRNFWDDAQSWGSVLGLVVGGSSLFMSGNFDPSTDSGKTKVGFAVTGAGLAGLSQVFGQVFGKDKGDAIRQKLEFVEFTRQAYDDLAVEKQHIANLLTENATLTADTKAFQTRYLAAATEQDQQDNLDELAVRINGFATTLREVPDTIAFYQQIGSKYYETNAEIKKAIDDIRADAAKVDTDFKQNLLPVLITAPRLQAVLRRPTSP